MDKTAHIVALSGGKDSTALALRLNEVYPREYIYICTPTGDELPEMQTHWDKLSKRLQKPIIKLYNTKYKTIYDLIEHFQALPNFRQRWCTRILKIETAQDFYNLNKPAIIYVGLRADETNRKGNTLFDANVTQVFPMQEWGWTINDVKNYLIKKEIEIPRRTDCAMCFYQRIGEWWMLWKEHPEHFKKLSDLEDKIGHTLMTIGKHKIWPHKLSDLANEFNKGRKPREIKSKQKTSITQCRICTL